MNSYQKDKKKKRHKYTNTKKRKITGVEITPSQQDSETHILLFHRAGREARGKADWDFRLSDG